MKVEDQAVADDLPKGTKLSSSHLIWVRPGIGLSPGEEKNYRKKTRRNLKMGHIIKKLTFNEFKNLYIDT